MASFVEQATLKVNDQSSAAIRKINAELRKLDQTAKSLRSTRINITVNDRGIQQAIANLRALQNAVRSLGSHRINLSVNTSGIAQAAQQIQRLRQQAARPITVNTRGTGGAGGGGPPGGGPPGPRPGVRNTGTGFQYGNFSVLRGAASVLVGGTAYALGAAFMRAIKEGTHDVDVGMTSLQLKQLDRIYGENAHFIAESMLIAAQNEATKMPYGGAFWNVGQRAQNFSEALGITQARDQRPGRGRPSGLPEYRPALAVASQLEELTRTLVGLGQTSEKATSEAMNFAKGLEQTGRFTDRLTGIFDTQKMQESFAYFQQLMPTIGKEFSGTFARNMIKYLSTEKYTVSNRALGAVMLLGEEYGTRAAVGYHQAVKQLSGMGQKKPQMAFLLAEGLLETAGYKTTGKGKRAKRAPIVGEAVDADLLREDLPAWIDKHLVPILEKQARAEATKQVRSGEISTTDVDRFVEQYKSDPNKIAALAYKVVGDRTAVETVAAFLERSQEIQRALNETALRSGKPEDVRKATQFSINIATAQLSNQFKGALGTMAQSAAPWLVPQMQRASNEFSKISTSFMEAQKEGKFPLDAMQRISNVMTPLALGAAIASAVSDPRNAPLAVASIGLITAGHLLIAAANKLAGTPDETTSPFGKAATPEEFSLLASQRKLSLLKEDRANVEKLRAAAQKNLAADKRFMEDFEAAERAGVRMPPARRAAYNERVRRVQAAEAQVAEQDAQITKLQADIAALERQIMIQQAEAITGKKYDEKMVLYLEARRREAIEAEAERKRVKAMTPAQRRQYWADKAKQVPLPRPRPPDIVESKPPTEPVPVTVEDPARPLPVTPVGPTVTAPTTPLPVPGVLPPSFLDDLFAPFMRAPAVTPGAPRPLGEIIDLGAAQTQFASFFQSGATTIANSGTTVGTNAAGTLEGRAGGIGAAIGDAAASRISQATVNVQIPNFPNQADRGPQNV